MPSKPVHVPPAAADAIARGQLIEAIKIVRDANQLDLRSAKEAVDAYVARRTGNQPPPARQAQVASPEFPPAASAALARGDIIEAIKLVREANRHLGLKEAKDAVDTLRAGTKIRSQPRMQPRSMPTVVEGDRGLGGWMVLIAVVIAAFAWWWLSP